MVSIWNKVAALLKAPFVGSLDLSSLVWLVGAVMVIAIFWGIVINHITRAAESI